MIRWTLMFILGLGILGESRAQDSLSWGVFRELRPQVGYVLNIESSDKTKYHFIDIGIMKVRSTEGIHPSSSAIYFSNEIGLDSKFVWGPKLGGVISLMFLVVGAEVVYYTDFDSGSLRLIPYFGFGSHKLRFTINPNITLTKGGFPLNSGNLNITISPFKLSQRRVQ